jgi:DNA-binding NarL/FixJ family response regulator
VEPGKIGLLVVDHNPMIREGLSLLIRLEPDLELLAVAETADDGVALFRKHRPDVTLMDLDLPDGAGITAVEQIRIIDPSTPILGLLTYEWDERAEAGIRAGASSYVTKDRLHHELIPRIRELLRALNSK